MSKGIAIDGRGLSTSAGGDWKSLSAHLRENGFCKLPDVVPSDLLGRLRSAGDELGRGWTERHGDLLKNQGSMVNVTHMTDPVFGDLITLPALHDGLDRLGLEGSAFSAGYVISKPPGSARLFWHFDWYGWEHDASYQVEPVQLFAMIYLTDTSRENGCLRVIPGSHLHRHEVHDLMRDGHVELGSTDDTTGPEFADWQGEVDVSVNAGDMVLGDARLLHAAHANHSNERRSLVTLWFHPHFASMDERLQPTFADYVQHVPEGWPQELRNKVISMQPTFDGDASPLSRTLHGPQR